MEGTGRLSNFCPDTCRLRVSHCFVYVIYLLSFQGFLLLIPSSLTKYPHRALPPRSNSLPTSIGYGYAGSQGRRIILGAQLSRSVLQTSWSLLLEAVRGMLDYAALTFLTTPKCMICILTVVTLMHQLGCLLFKMMDTLLNGSPNIIESSVKLSRLVATIYMCLGYS